MCGSNADCYSGTLLRFFRLATTVLLVCECALLEGCGGGSVSTGGSTSGLGTATVTVAPASSGVTTAQPLQVAVAVSGSGTTPAGTVVVSIGSFASFPASLSGGSATIQIPAGVLAVGNDTLTASYKPASTSAYASSQGTGPIAVTAGTVTPTVTASYVTYPTAGNPFQAVVTGTGTVLVAVNGASRGIQVFVPGGGGLTSSCVNPLLPALVSEGGSVSNLTILPNGTDIAAGIGSPGAAFFNLATVESCTASTYVVSQGSIAADEGTLDVDITPDGKFAFVSNEYGEVSGESGEGNVGVVALTYDANGDVVSGTLLGQIATGGNAIAGITLSPDGTRLYVTSEVAEAGTKASGASNPIQSKNDCVQTGSPQLNGLLTVIDVAAAEGAPKPSAIVATVDAGCSPVRMAETADGSTLWVAARGDNRVLAFSTGMLEFNADDALLGYAGTGGTEPVGVKLFDNDQLLAVANSNRFGTGPMANATILYVAVPATASVVQTVATGLFPREFWVGPDDATLYLTNFDSDSLEVISTSE